MSDNDGPIAPTVATASHTVDCATALSNVQTCYEQLHEGIGRLDLKASIVATVDVAATASVLGAFVQPHPGIHQGWLGAGLCALLVGLGCAGAAVMPRVGVFNPRKARSLAENLLNIHRLRNMDGRDLAKQLAQQSDEQRLEDMANQLVWLAKVVWSKHMWTQRSLVAAAVALVMIVAAYFA